MARTRFDQLSKQLLEEFLTPVGKVEKSLEVLGEARFVDIWFVPFAQPVMPPEAIGLFRTSGVLPPQRSLAVREIGAAVEIRSIPVSTAHNLCNNPTLENLSETRFEL